MRLNKKKKKILAISSIGALGLAIITIPTVALVGCATTSSPYGPFTNVEVTTPLSSTQPLLLNYQTNQQNAFTALSNTGGLNIPAGLLTGNQVTSNEIGNWIGFGTNQKIVNTSTKPTSTTDVTVGKKKVAVNVQQMLNDYNAINLSTTITSSIMSLIREVVTFDTLSQPFGFNAANSQTNDWNGTQVSQWNKQIGANQAGRAFTVGLNLGAGVGANMYALWPSAIKFGWKIVPAAQNPLATASQMQGTTVTSSSSNSSSTSTGTNSTTAVLTTTEQKNSVTPNKTEQNKPKEQVTPNKTESNTPKNTGTQSPTTSSLQLSPLGVPNAGQGYDYNQTSKLNYTLEVTNVSITYSWFQKLKTGGDWATNISQVNKQMTYQQKQILANVLGDGQKTATYSNLSYNIKLGNLDFNVNPAYSTQTVSSTSSSSTTTAVLASTNSSSDSEKMNYYTGVVNIGIPNVPQKYVSSSKDKSSSSSDNQSITSFTNMSDASYFTTANQSGTPDYNLQNFKSFATLIGQNFFEGQTNSVTDKPIYNNINTLPFQVYRSIWLMGAMSGLNAPSMSNIESSKPYTTMMSDQNSINQTFLNDKPTSKEVTKLFGATNYQTGLNILYSIMNINSITAMNQYPNNILGKNAAPFLTPETKTTSPAQPASKAKTTSDSKTTK